MRFCCCWCCHLTSAELMTQPSSPGLLVKRFSGGTRWESVFLPGLFSVTHHWPVSLLCPGQCLIHTFCKSWMHKVQKPLVPSSFLPRESIIGFTSSPLLMNLLQVSSCDIWFSTHWSVRSGLPAPAFCCASLSTSHVSHTHTFPPCTCFYSYNAQWCHRSASNETQHIKISFSLARTFRPRWIIHLHISAPHPMTPREVLLFSTLSNEIWMALFLFSLAWSSHRGGFNRAEVIRFFWKLPAGGKVDAVRKVVADAQQPVGEAQCCCISQTRQTTAFSANGCNLMQIITSTDRTQRMCSSLVPQKSSASGGWRYSTSELLCSSHYF